MLSGPRELRAAAREEVMRNVVLGAIGVSGGTGAQDDQVSKAGLAGLK